MSVIHNCIVYVYSLEELLIANIINPGIDLYVTRDWLKSLWLHFLVTTCWTPYSIIHSVYFYSTSSSPLLLRGAPNTARIPCRSFTSKRHRQLRVKDFPKVPAWQLERNSNPRPFGRKALNLPMSHHTPCH